MHLGASHRQCAPVCVPCLSVGAFGVRAWLAKDSYRGRGRDEDGLHRPSGTTGFGRVGRRVDVDAITDDMAEWLADSRNVARSGV